MAAADPAAAGTAAPALMAACVAAGASWATMRARAFASPPVAERRPHTVRFGDDGRDKDGRPAKGKVRERLMRPSREVEDDLFWLRSDKRSDKEVIDLVRHENEYALRNTAHLEGLQGELYKEMLGRVQETDASAPVLMKGWYHYSRTEAGRPYRVHCCKPAPEGAGQVGFKSPGSPDDLLEEEVVLLDENELAEGHEYCDVGDMDASPSGWLLAYSVDFDGDEQYEIRVRRLDTGEGLDDVLRGTSGSIVWCGGEGAIVYTTLDDEHRCNRVWRHVLGRPQAEDELLFEDTDPLFSVGAFTTLSERFLVIESGSIETSEAWVIDLESPDAEGGAAEALKPLMRCVEPRSPGLRYDVDHRGGVLLVVHNDGGARKNGVLAVTPTESIGRASWRDLVPYDEAVEVKSASAYRSHVVVRGRQHGSPQLWVIPGAALDACTADGATGSPQLLRVPTREDVYSLRPSGNQDFTSSFVRFAYSSPLTPAQTLEISVPEAVAASGAGVSTDGSRSVVEVGPSSPTVALLRQRPAPNVDPSAYACHRVYCPVKRREDGPDDDVVFVPVSLLWRPDRHEGAPAADVGATGLPSTASGARDAARASLRAPLLLYGYGSYGISIDPGFSSSNLSFVDRGGVYAVAHIRGGGEMGRRWYEDEGKFLTKQNTFRDFVEVAGFLSATGWADASRVGILGRSAGGLLVGRCLTMRPDLWRCAVADVPFVDLMTTMQDESIPLTTGEWEEWGNPNEAEYFDYMRQYSPMDTVPRGVDLPDVLLTAGLQDPRVQYWEPLKFAQRLRELGGPGSRPVLLKTDMSSGHFSASDRYKYIREQAFEMAYILDRLGMA